MDALDRIKDLMMSSGIEANKADEVSRKIKHEFGGEAFYIPKKPGRAVISDAIRRNISYREICARYGVSLATVYRIKKWRRNDEF